MNAMNEQQLQAQRDRLQAMDERLRAAVYGLAGEALRGTGGEAAGNLSNAPMHLADLATTNYDQEVASGLLQTEQQILRAIRAAIERIDAGTYGRCEVCGRELPAGRLEAVPYATTCVACESKREEAESDDLGRSSWAGVSQAAPTLATKPRRNEPAGTGAETVPPGAGVAAQARATTPPRGPNDDAVTVRTIDDPAKGEKAR
jgi:DnaK suppressor protein